MMEEIRLSSEERLDELGRKGYRIIQNTKTFCFGIDAVLLADFARISPSDRVADLGSGNGILPLLLAGRDKGASFAAIEIQPLQASLARRNAALNGLSERIEVFEADLTEASSFLPKGSFDAVVTNPPYMKKGSGLLNPEDAKAIARHELRCSLSDVLRESGRLLKPGGSLFLVHRCWRLGEVLVLLPKEGLTPKRLRIVHSYSGTEGELFLLEAKRGAGDGLTVLKPCVIYESAEIYTEELRRMYYGEDAVCEGRSS